jgi:hypothetical protein
LLVSALLLMRSVLTEKIARGLAGLFAASAGVSRRAAGPAHLPDPAGQAAGLGQRAAEQVLDLGVSAAQVIACPPGQRVVHGRVEAEQHLFAFVHYW